MRVGAGEVCGYGVTTLVVLSITYSTNKLNLGSQYNSYTIAYRLIG